jgi:MraZ protein
MWYGEFSHTLDEKDRFILPAKFRDKVKTFKERRLYITRGLEGCLALYAESEWIMIKDKLESLSFTKQQSRFFNRLFFSGASQIDVDSQGRISIPQYLKEFASIQREVMIVGVGNRIEVWGKASWNKFYKENRKRFEEMAENLFEN